MKIIILFAVVTAAVALGHKKCEPGSYFKEYCNHCVCSNDGLNYACTRMACNKRVHNKDGSLKAPLICEPGAIYYDYCNICACAEDGLSRACTKNECDKDKYNEDGSIKQHCGENKNSLVKGEEQVVCEPSKPFKLYCNQCACSNDGARYACTKMFCDKRIWNKDGSMKPEAQSNRVVRSADQKQICTPYKRFKEYCNDCRCSNDGTAKACTDMECDTDVYNRDGSLKRRLICEPGKTFKDRCNSCVCGKDGRTKACTEMACP